MYKSTFLFDVEDNNFPKNPKRNESFFQLPNNSKYLPSKKDIIISNWQISCNIKNINNSYSIFSYKLLK